MNKLFRKIFPSEGMRKFRKMHRRHRKELVKLAKETGEWDSCWLHRSVIMQIMHMHEYYYAGNNVWQVDESRLEIVEQLQHILDLVSELERVENDDCGFELIFDDKGYQSELMNSVLGEDSNKYYINDNKTNLCKVEISLKGDHLLEDNEAFLVYNKKLTNVYLINNENNKDHHFFKLPFNIISIDKGDLNKIKNEDIVIFNNVTLDSLPSHNSIIMNPKKGSLFFSDFIKDSKDEINEEALLFLINRVFKYQVKAEQMLDAKSSQEEKLVLFKKYRKEFLEIYGK